jgi:hypothetical protein
MANNTGVFFNINDNDGIPLVGVSTDGRVLINHLYGNCLIGSTTPTGTSSQPLQVTGGAYVSGNLGIGITNPTEKLQIEGNISVNGIITASSFVGNLTGTASTAVGLGTTSSINTTGIITASSFVGNLTGTATTSNNVSSTININTTGIITASSFVGNLTGTASTAVGLSTTSSINTTGIITASSFVGNLTGTATTSNNVSSTININTTGIITASSFVGNLTGTATTSNNVSSTININTTGIITASSIVVGSGGTIFTSSSSGLVGIGSTNPKVKLDVIGDVNILGILTASKVASGIPNNNKTSAYILTKSDVGKYISISSGGVTVPAGIFSEGDVISIYNNSSNNQTITQATLVTMYFSGTSTTGNRTLSQRGLSTILCVGSNTFIIGGSGIS